MSIDVNTSSLMTATTTAEVDDRPTVIEVDHVSMVFNIANQQLNNLKEYAIALMRRELMFKEFVALDDVSLEVKKGDVFGILGTNGSGKSTLLKIIAGVLEPTRGDVIIHGSIAPLIELGAGFDFELTARENIYLNGALLGYPRKFIDEHFDDIVDFAEIGDFLDMPIKNYSSGMVARIAFAIATVIVPDILIVDEVLSVGDFMFQQKCEQKIQSLINEHGVTVLIVSHNNDQIERLCNKAIWIEKGHTRIIGTAEEVCSVYRALGGHTGSAEAEAIVLETLQSDVPIDENALHVLAGDTRYSTNLLLAKKTDALKRDTVVIAPGEDADVHLLAVVLAGALNATALIARSDELSDAAALLLAQADPARVVLLERDGGFEPTVHHSVIQAIGKDREVTSLGAADLAALSRKVLAYAEAQNAVLGPVAFIAGDHSAFASATLAPYFARHGSQLLFATAEEPLTAKDIQQLRERGMKEIVVLGNAVMSQDALDAIDEAALPVARLAADTPELAHEEAFRWIIDRHRATGDEPHRLILTTLGGPSDSYSAAFFAAHSHGIIMMADHNDLDSMARALSFISEQRGAIDSITIIGNDACFNATDKKLFRRALARAKKDPARS